MGSLSRDTSVLLNVTNASRFFLINIHCGIFSLINLAFALTVKVMHVRMHAHRNNGQPLWGILMCGA